MFLLSTPRKVFLVLMAGLVGLAWFLLWLWGVSPYSRYLDHSHLDGVYLGDIYQLLIFVAGWTLMTVAMMLPTVLPLISLFFVVTKGKPNQGILIYLLLVGYLGAWTAFGIVAHLGDWLIHKTVDQSPWLQERAWILGSIIILTAGIYQFTPLKYHCLEKCRSPLSFITENWGTKNSRWQSLKLGFVHGKFCIGCCWSLMLLMFVMGTGNLGWMVMLGGVMSVEKNVGWGRKISKPLGLILIAWGMVSLLKF